MSTETVDETALRLTGLHYHELIDLPVCNAMAVSIDEHGTLYRYNRLGVNPSWVELAYLKDRSHAEP